MFKKLLSNLPFNPSLIGQVAFYAQRVHKESVVRRSGLIILSLALTLQVFAVISPPQPSLARSNNDLVNGGFTTKNEATSYCKNNTRHYQDILKNYGISCDDVAATTTVNIKSTDYSKRFYSMGWLAYGKTGETPVNIAKVGTLYARPLWSWDTSGASHYKALKGTTKFGATFFLLYDCGNLTFIGLPTPPKTCTYNNTILATDSKCFAPCPVSGKSNVSVTSKDCSAPCQYNKKILANDSKCFAPCPVKGKVHIPKDSAECFEPCPYNSTIDTKNPACKPCEASQTKEDLTACLQYSKTATNKTQNFPDANGTTAKSGDTIEYTLKTTNQGKATITQYAISENISDVLDYASVVNTHGGTINDSNIISWPAQDIAGGKTIEKLITIRIKDPLPDTPTSSSDPGHFDLAMTNVYGNTVTIKLPPSVVKSTEIVTTQLPNTGPGTSLIAAFTITLVTGYLFARSRLLAKELDVVRVDFSSNGGN